VNTTGDAGAAGCAAASTIVPEPIINRPRSAERREALIEVSRFPPVYASSERRGYLAEMR
jgi:hypothetical protein